MGNAAREHKISPLLRRPEVERLTGLRKTAIYEQMAAGTFPQPRRISVRCVAWVAAEVEEWIAARPTR
jgi:prophage regulatory protein